jgi:hypothetical protein
MERRERKFLVELRSCHLNPSCNLISQNDLAQLDFERFAIGDQVFYQKLLPFSKVHQS